MAADLCCAWLAVFAAHHCCLQDLNRVAITELLDSCLLTEAEMKAAKSAEDWLQEDPLFGSD